MARPVKFTYDRVFASERGDVAAPEVFGRKELEAAREKAWQDGLAEGAADERASAERRRAEALEAIAERLCALVRDQAEVREQTVRRGIGLALAIARKIAPELVRRQPVAEIEAMIGACLGQLIDEPRVVVRVPDPVLDDIQARIDALAAAQGFDGRIVLMAEPALGPGDCRIEWADGGAERDTEAVWRDLEAGIQRLLDGPGATGEPAAEAAAEAASTERLDD